jgi:hypothetical protein
MTTEIDKKISAFEDKFDLLTLDMFSGLGIILAGVIIAGYVFDWAGVAIMLAGVVVMIGWHRRVEKFINNWKQNK